jgi:hypothetical protein
MRPEIGHTPDQGGNPIRVQTNVPPVSLGSSQSTFRIETALAARAERPQRTRGAHGRETQANSRAKLPPVADDE